MSTSTARFCSHAIVSPGSLTRPICSILRARSFGDRRHSSGTIPPQPRKSVPAGAHPEQPNSHHREIHVKKSIILAAIAVTALGLGSAAVLAQGQGGGGGGGRGG